MQDITARGRNIRSYLVRFVIVFIAMVMAFSAFPQQVSATPSESYITLNIYGALGNKGKTTKVTRDVVALVKEHKPLAIGLQEVCERQHKSIHAALKKLGYYGTFTQTKRSGNCNDKSHGNELGNSMYVRGKYTNRTRTSLPWGKNDNDDRGRQPRALLCVTFQKTRICDVHLSPGNPDNDDQLDKVARTLKPWAEKGKLILMGDFNRSSSDVAKKLPFLVVCNNPSRIDHVLSTDGGLTCTESPVPSSDHAAVIATK